MRSIFLLVTFSCALGLTNASSGKPPNIVWITVEDMGPRLGCYGDQTVSTPHIDRIAREGVRYTRAFGVYGVCAPNRHCLILGMYPTSTGAMAMRTWKRTSALDQITDPALLAIPTYEATPPNEARCFTEYLRAAGYYCTNNFKTDYQFQDPFTAWDESSPKAHWRKRPRPDQPFFAVFNHATTHESKTFEQSSPRVTDPDKVELPPYYPDRPLVRRDLARHYDNIAAVDRQVGVLLSQLEEDNLLNETLIFFFSDHGDGLPRMKRWVYDSGIQVPLLIRFPRPERAGGLPRGSTAATHLPEPARAGTVNQDLVSFVDFAPTILNLAGLNIPDHMQGQPFLGPETPPARQYIFAARDRMDPAPETIRAVRDRRFKYIRNYRPELPYLGFIPYRDRAAIMQEILRLRAANELGAAQWQFWAETKPLEELYDTQNDPHEIHNLANQPKHFDKLAELREAHLRWTAETGDLGHIPESELIQRLWPGGVQPQTSPPEVQVEPTESNKRRVKLACSSPGSSIAYRIGDSGRWLLYSRPFDVKPGALVAARANRLGWLPSEPVSVTAE